MFTPLNFDPVNDFEHVTTLSAIPFILLVAADSKYKTVSDLVADLKEKGDKASYGSTSLPGVVSSELFKVSFGLQTVEVKYKDTAPMLNELVAGNLVFGHLDPASAMGYVKQGKIRALATSSKQRFVSLPDIPSASEAGIQNSDVVGWWSVHVPKGTPTPIVTKLETWFNQIAVDDDVKAFLANLGADPLPGNAVMLKELLVKEIASWKEYVKLAKIEPMG
jgi:tripartite-type tricarboxylate transporter receptor subunit TctC